MLSVNASVRMIIVQFSFSNKNVIPRLLVRSQPETEQEHVERRNRSTGVMIIPPTESCSLEGLLESIEVRGYEMVNSFCKERIDSKDPMQKRTYWMVRFQFVKSSLIDLSEDFFSYKEKYREFDRNGFVEMCKDVAWRSRVFLNPFYEEGRELPDYRAISINLESRQPFLQPNGKLMKVWLKDKKGRRLGQAPIPIRAKNRFCFEDDIFKVVKV